LVNLIETDLNLEKKFEKFEGAFERDKIYVVVNLE
jgi:hypothetical protein